MANYDRKTIKRKTRNCDNLHKTATKIVKFGEVGGVEGTIGEQVARTPEH